MEEAQAPPQQQAVLQSPPQPQQQAVALSTPQHHDIDFTYEELIEGVYRMQEEAKSLLQSPPPPQQQTVALPTPQPQSSHGFVMPSQKISKKTIYWPYKKNDKKKKRISDTFANTYWR